MKRSEINRLEREAVKFFKKHHFELPRWAYFRPRDWKKAGRDIREFRRCKLGWDLTDFGSGDFRSFGLVLFTVRNGDPSGRGKTYCEKAMIIRKRQMVPTHFHWHKMEDIINRGGGNLMVQLWNSTKSDGLSKRPVSVKVDGLSRKVRAGGSVRLRPGESVCLPPRLYHRFFVEKGTADVLIGEVSMVNDDDRDNRFYKPVGRFPKIIEDEDVLYPLCFEYP